MASLLKSRRTWVTLFGVTLLAAFLWDWVAHLGGLDPDLPYIIQFGRGSGWHGLDTAKIAQDGAVTLHRQLANQEGPFWETATLKLRQESLARVLDAVEKNRLFGLRKAYHGNVADGTQWVLWLKQGDREKAVYFDNHFPPEIERFADALDTALAENGLEKAEWRYVGGADARGHERALWDSIR
jgi:hypothetical protein